MIDVFEIHSRRTGCCGSGILINGAAGVPAMTGWERGWRGDELVQYSGADDDDVVGLEHGGGGSGWWGGWFPLVVPADDDPALVPRNFGSFQ